MCRESVLELQKNAARDWKRENDWLEYDSVKALKQRKDIHTYSVENRSVPFCFSCKFSILNKDLTENSVLPRWLNEKNWLYYSNYSSLCNSLPPW